MEQRTECTDRELVEKAVQAMQKAYAPYSGFRVGAALETADGQVYTGANIENAAYTPSVCAERVAFFTAIHSRDISPDFDAPLPVFRRIAVVGGKNGILTAPTYPCGVCRQVMREFCTDAFRILTFDGTSVFSVTLGELFPHAFGPDTVK